LLAPTSWRRKSRDSKPTSSADALQPRKRRAYARSSPPPRRHATQPNASHRTSGHVGGRPRNGSNRSSPPCAMRMRASRVSVASCARSKSSTRHEMAEEEARPATRTARHEDDARRPTDRNRCACDRVRVEPVASGPSPPSKRPRNMRAGVFARSHIGAMDLLPRGPLQVLRLTPSRLRKQRGAAAIRFRLRRRAEDAQEVPLRAVGLRLRVRALRRRLAADR
jgi:hypothetical protein